MSFDIPAPKKVRINAKKVLEKDIENPVCKYARAKGLLAYKFTSPNRRSVPDRIFIGPDGLVFFIEFKAPGAKPTESQAREIRRLRALGHIVEVVDNVLKGQRLIDVVTE